MEAESIFLDLAPEYKITKKIGAGAYSSVWDAVHVATGRRVAIKRECGVFEDAIDCKRLLREIKLLRCLVHPNVVTLLDVLIPPDSSTENFDTIYLILEIADTSLANIIRSKIYLDAKQVKMIMYNTLVGLNYIHSAGVLHRDIKPGNVLVNKDCSVRICDFGLSRSVVWVPKKAPAITKPKQDEPIDSPSESSSESSDEEPPMKDIAPKPTKKPGKARMSISAAATEDVAAFAASQSQSENAMDLSESDPKDRTLTRRLTSHVVTRWYRAPEIILMQENYGPPIDIWACGCIFAELLSTVKENVPSIKDRKPLFPGTSCLLLSPIKSGSGGRGSILSVASTDQLLIIIDILGNPGEEDLSFVHDKNVLDFIKSLPAKETKINFDEKFPAAGKEAIDLLKHMLMFNPAKRIKTEECLNHPYFSQFRVKANETKSMAPVSFAFESEEEELSEKRLRSLFAEEIEFFRKKRTADALKLKK